jgi:hypothetical protein
LNFNPHLHIIATDGCFDENGIFMKSRTPNATELEAVFASEVFNMLIEEDKIEHSLVKNMSTWMHSGFNVYCGEPVSPYAKEDMERLAQYIVRAPLSQERMSYLSENEAPDSISKVIYEGKTSRSQEVFSALDWLARLVTHIPSKGEQLVRYYGYYSNKSRGVRNKSNDEKILTPAEAIILNSNISRKKYRKNWARLIKKVFNIDPLLCPKCDGKMKIISFIEDHATIKQILVHLNLWMNHDPPPTDKSESKLSAETLLRSFEWWETTKNISYTDDSYQQPFYEDDFSQEASYED